LSKPTTGDDLLLLPGGVSVWTLIWLRFGYGATLERRLGMAELLFVASGGETQPTAVGKGERGFTVVQRIRTASVTAATGGQ
jgi:hypothetical protein